MKVKDLIRILSEFKDDNEVIIGESNYEWTQTLLIFKNKKDLANIDKDPIAEIGIEER